MGVEDQLTFARDGLLSTERNGARELNDNGRQFADRRSVLRGITSEDYNGRRLGTARAPRTKVHEIYGAIADVVAE